MRKFLLFLFIIVQSDSFAQKAQFDLFTSIDIPNKTQMPSMQNVFSVGLGFGYRPFFGVPMLLEFKAAMGRYASESEKWKYYLYENHGTTTVRFNYSSELNKFLLGSKWLIRHDFRTFRAYATPQIGLVTLKTLNGHSYDDPNDENHTKSFTSQRNTKSVYGGELGFEIVLNDLFKNKMKKNNTHRVHISATFLRSFKEVGYTNVNELINQYSLTEEQVNSGNYVHMKNDLFVDDYALEVHQAKLAMWGINIGYIFNIDYKDK
jgi:hypothetical protein